ncbi:hypothetical protein G3578_09650 [Brevibacillus sp. SYP-B805]|uniref:hypothetical protein n=1 Tax=Brevibacillus sp. SYP-B805 TaxID=1578199 RepID=UPI0013ECF2B2|nr:hypothetical protein [Brevibacillus sp. SYP-B805]NGQ95419.1 hypothetical protein [Brevibacillus sp. SYP-B805]
MRIIHFFPKSKALGFLDSFKDFLHSNYEELYNHFSRTEDFYGILDSRIYYTDIIVITAHGYPDYIVGEEVSGEAVLLTLEQFHRCKHSFIFAFSCSTGDLGAQICREHKAIAYLGFNDIIDLVVKTEGQAYKNELKKILRKIYNDSLCKSFTEFLANNYNIDQFARLISKNLELSYSLILAMSPEQLKITFSLPQKVVDEPKFLKILQTDLLTTINSVRKRIVIHGEPEFIPWLFIDTKDKTRIEQLISKIEKSVFKDSYNNYYKYFLLGHLYRALGIASESKKFFRLAYSLNSEYIRLNSYLNDNEIEELIQTG